MKVFALLALALALVLPVNSVFASTFAPQEDSAGAVTATDPEAQEPAPTTDESAEAAPVETDFSGADITWMLVCSALVLMMTAPGLALFYGGLVRKKNILSVMMQCVFLMGLMTVLWAVVGYSLAFGGSDPYFGNFDHVCLQGVTPTYANGSVSTPALTPGEGGIPLSVFMCFQGMFFIITPALICGAFAERMKFSTMCVLLALWGLLIYCPICHWVWSDNGWLCEWNDGALFPSLDFAGGTVVHISSGVSALVCALFLGSRMGYGSAPMPPHNLTYTCIGTALLWVGWFGFNAGSALSAGTGAVNAFIATHLCAAAGVISWAGAEWLFRGKPTMLGACSGAVAGLVCITPACGSVTPMSAIVLGLIVGVVCYWACTSLKGMFKYDDSLDAFGVHGVGGTVGAILTGIFANRAITGELETRAGQVIAGERMGLIESNFSNFTQLINQLVGILAAAGLAIVGTLVLLMVLNVVMGLRVTPEQEQKGLDITQHGEEGYIFL